MHITFWSENLYKREQLEDLFVDGRTILKCILVKLGGRLWPGLFGSESGLL
jgi:hypothetical protein